MKWVVVQNRLGFHSLLRTFGVRLPVVPLQNRMREIVKLLKHPAAASVL